MDQYSGVSQAVSRVVTTRYSSSFSLAARLFGRTIQPHIYNIYGLVRVADEIVDTYGGPDARELLDELEAEVAAAIVRGYSPNLVVHAFALSAREYQIGAAMTGPFFASMRLDLEPDRYQPSMYEEYINGSAEVVGLMCLRVFVGGNPELFRELEPGARALGSAFQKVNFLRDLAEDHDRLGRYYFPIGSYDSFSTADRDAIVADIEADFTRAEPAVRALPEAARPAVLAAYRYYCELLSYLKATPVATLKHQRMRISNQRKLWVLAETVARERLSLRQGRV